MQNQLQTTPVDAQKVVEFGAAMANTPVIMGLISHNDYIAMLVDNLLGNVKLRVQEVTPVPGDVKSISADHLSSLDSYLQEVQNKLNSAVEKQKQYRMPLTRAWEENVLKKFTDAESRVSAVISQIKTQRKELAAEISRRNNMAKEATQKSTAKTNERISYVASLTKYVSSKTIEFAATRVEQMARVFYSITLDKFDTYAKNLSAWSPALTDTEFISLCQGFAFNWVEHDLTKEPAPVFTAPEFASLKKDMDALFYQSVNTEKELLVSKLPQRKLELQSGFETNIEVEVSTQLADFKKASDTIAAAQTAAVDTSAAVARVDAEFEASAAAPTVAQSSGTSEKMTLVPSTHAHWAAIIQKWIADEFPHCTMEELSKKFDFMLKKMINMGNATNVWPAGVPLEKDFSVRSGRKKKD